MTGTKYNQRLATLCEYLQAIDRDGDFLDLYEEYQVGEITLTKAMEAVRNALNNLLDGNPNDNTVKRMIRYAND